MGQRPPSSWYPRPPRRRSTIDEGPWYNEVEEDDMYYYLPQSHWTISPEAMRSQHTMNTADLVEPGTPAQGRHSAPPSFPEPQGYTAVAPYPVSVAYSLGRPLASSSSAESKRISTDFTKAIDEPDILAYLVAFFLDTIPRQIYLHLLLRLPNFYFSRVARIFNAAKLSIPEIERMAQEMEASGIDRPNWNLLLKQGPVSRHYATAYSPLLNLQDSWESFIDSVLREWKTLNIVSVLLLS